MSTKARIALRNLDEVALECRNGIVPHVRIASTFGSRFIGLMNRSRLGAEEGLLFVPGGGIHTCWMRFAIDVIFLDAQLEAVRVISNVLPWRLVPAPRRTHYVLELAAGSAPQMGIEEGTQLRICR
ncbi:MAG TPA: DUF192 domain-containing protein [Steroidobacteraceae bacterium]